MPHHRPHTHAFGQLWWRQPGTLSTRWWHLLSSLSMLLKVSNLTPLPPSIHTRRGCHVTNGDMATNNGWRMTNCSQQGEPSHWPPLSFFQQVPCWPPPTEQQCGTTTMMWRGHDNPSDHNDNTRNFILQLLLPCQLTCALHSRGINVTLGCTLHGFLTCETPCTPLPVPTDYPDPCQGYGFLEGMGIGHRKVTRGLPVPITRYSMGTVVIIAMITLRSQPKLQLRSQTRSF